MSSTVITILMRFRIAGDADDRHGMRFLKEVGRRRDLARPLTGNDCDRAQRRVFADFDRAGVLVRARCRLVPVGRVIDCRVRVVAGDRDRKRVGVIQPRFGERRLRGHPCHKVRRVLLSARGLRKEHAVYAGVAFDASAREDPAPTRPCQMSRLTCPARCTAQGFRPPVERENGAMSAFCRSLLLVHSTTR